MGADVDAELEFVGAGDAHDGAGLHEVAGEHVERLDDAVHGGVDAHFIGGGFSEGEGGGGFVAQGAGHVEILDAGAVDHLFEQGGGPVAVRLGHGDLFGACAFYEGLELFAGGGEFGLGQLAGGAGGIQHLRGDGALGEEAIGAAEIGFGVVERGLGAPDGGAGGVDLLRAGAGEGQAILLLGGGVGGLGLGNLLGAGAGLDLGEIRLGLRQLGAGGADLGLDLAAVQLDDQVALMHGVALVGMDAQDAAADFGAGVDVDAFDLAGDFEMGRRARRTTDQRGREDRDEEERRNAGAGGRGERVLHACASAVSMPCA